MKLKKGITGFIHITEKDAIPKIDEKKLKNCARLVDYSTNFKLDKIISPDPSLNFYRISYKHSKTEAIIDLIINRHYPYFAGIDSNSSWTNLVFIHLPEEIMYQFEYLGFEYLTPELLNSQFKKEDLKALSTVEIQQINNWKSRTYGKVVFNGYD